MSLLRCRPVSHIPGESDCISPSFPDHLRRFQRSRPEIASGHAPPQCRERQTNGPPNPPAGPRDRPAHFRSRRLLARVRGRAFTSMRGKSSAAAVQGRHPPVRSIPYRRQYSSGMSSARLYQYQTQGSWSKSWGGREGYNGIPYQRIGSSSFMKAQWVQ
jgi:hypothetical protein